MSARTPNPQNAQFGRGVQIKKNQDLLREMPEFARSQIEDYRHGRNNTRVAACRTNSALPDRSWTVVEDQVYHVKKDTLTLVADLEERGLRTEQDIMTKHDTWPYVDDRGEANIDMTPEVASDEGALTWQSDGVPIPVIYDFFSLGFREGPSPDTENTPGEVSAGLDTLGLSTTTRRVNEKIEYTFLYGWDETIKFDGDGFTLYGLTNHPQTNTATFDEDWTTTTEASDGTTFRDEVRRARGILKNDNKFSPGETGYLVYLGTELYDSLDDADPEGDGNSDVRERVENLANISEIRELDYLGEDEMLMFRPTEDVIDVGTAAEVQPVMWDDPFRDHWAVLGSKYPRVKTTLTGQSGVVYFTM